MTDDAQSLDFYLVTEQSELYSITQEWQRLLEESANPQPMIDPRWLLSWWRNYGARVELAVGLLFRRGELVGLAPLCIRKYAYCPGLVFRRLQFLGVEANERDGLDSIYMNFIARSGYEEPVVRGFVSRIAAGEFGAWHEVMLGSLTANMPMTHLTRSAFGELGLSCNDKTGRIGYFAKLPATWGEYLETLPTANRGVIKTALTNFEAWAAPHGEWELKKCATPDALKTGLASLLAMQQEDWKDDGSDAALLPSPRLSAFLRDYVGVLPDPARVEIACLNVAGAPVAIAYTVRNGKTVLAYYLGRTTAVPAHVELGLALNALLLKDSIARGDTEFDFVGSGHRSRSLFANHERRIVSVRVAPLNSREVVRRCLVEGRDAVRATLGLADSFRRRSTLSDIRTTASH